ncbi:sensor histidine kinase [Hufsiella ginkgonis]|uniref:histidine kinase n=1 Tax=Hufsiella ginkgonis TaxID=2695274 RepID=A0A7K1Y1F7_9SPHI|nr:HAMP domain-containing sensor histidine kinase [Hufsiella ginkgonis]MXV17083.1 hypothetical protein [Hufsiella ginkgonis]
MYLHLLSTVNCLPNPRCGLFGCLLLLFLLSCSRKENRISDLQIEHDLLRVDSLYINRKFGEGTALLNSLGLRIKRNSPQSVNYYRLKVVHYEGNAAMMRAYADSALSFFSTPELTEKYKEQYVQVLLMKGDVCMRERKYNDALTYFYRGKVLLERNKGACGISDFTSAMAGLLYGQKKFAQAAAYWVESYRWMEKCKTEGTAQRYFHIQQGTLNNAGYAFENAGMIDSALYYYQKDVDLINGAEGSKIISRRALNSARLAVYDNIGSVYTRLNKRKLAKSFLLKSVALDLRLDGAVIPPLVKLARIHLMDGDYKAADSAFQRSRLLLNKFKDANLSSEIKWYKFRSEYYFKQHKLAEAYRTLEAYIRIKDSVERIDAELNKMDVNKEFKSLQQESSLNNLEKREEYNRYYLIGAAIFLLMLVIIVILVSKNLGQVKKNSRVANLNNLRLQRTLSELELANKNYIRIMRVMAHDLKNPLSGIIGLVSVLLEEDGFTEDQISMLKLIESTGSHSIGMINELLKSGLADEREHMVKTPVNLQTLLNDSVELLRFRAGEKHQEIVYEHTEPVWAEVNREKIWRVFNNLIINAIKFSPNNSRIKVEIRQFKRKVVIVVSDRGIGIPDENKELVFEMFTPAKRMGTNGEQPFGLGLSISKRIVELHNGRIWFKDNPDGGTEFFIELPV